jgi:hypothetical protein
MMLMQMIRFAVALVLLLAPSLDAQETPPPPPSQDSLNGISKRGMMLARYHFLAMAAAWSFEAEPGTEDQVPILMVRPDLERAEAVFGRLSDDSTSFLVAYAGLQDEGAATFTIRRNDPPVPDTGYFARAMRAQALANRDFGSWDRPFLSAPILADNGDFWVYVFPAARPPVYPVGGDYRYRVSSDGRRILDKRRLHNTVQEYRGSSERGEMVAQMSTAVLDDVPEDTDVYHVLTRRPSTPQYIITEGYVFRIEVNGAIRVAGRREDLMRP